MRALRHSLPWITLVGCTELVVVGDECQEEDTCLVELDGNLSAPAIDAALDATFDLDAQVASPALDASADAGDADRYVPAPNDAAVWRLPPLQNPSFELTDGQPGDVAALSLPTGTVIAPWFSCQPIGGGPGALTGVRAETLVALNDGLPTIVLPQDEVIFIGMQYFVALFPPALVQVLGTPLRAGTPYGFAIDVRTSNPSANLSLQVYGAHAACEGLAEATLLAQTDPIVASGWQTVCLRFTPPEDLPIFVLVENAASPLSGDRLFLDNLRDVEACRAR